MLRAYEVLNFLILKNVIRFSLAVSSSLGLQFLLSFRTELLFALCNAWVSLNANHYFGLAAAAAQARSQGMFWNGTLLDRVVYDLSPNSLEFR